MSDNLKVAKECGAFIEDGQVGRVEFSAKQLEAYTSRILASQQAAHDAEIAKLKEENAWYKSEGQALERTRITLCDGLDAANERNAHLEALVALQADGWVRFKRECHDSDDCFIPQASLNKMDAAISASAETVQAFRNKLTEPLRREVAMFTYGINAFRNACFGKQKHDAVVALWNMADNTQATAQAHEQRMKLEGAVEALEEMAQELDDRHLESLQMCILPSTMVRERATSKKG